MNIKDQFRQPWMGNAHLQVVLPFLDDRTTRKLLNNYINQGLIKLDEEPDTESPGRGRSRRFSLKNAIEFATLWNLVQIGYKPSAVVNIVPYVVARAEQLANTDPDDIAKNEHPMLVFYESFGNKIGRLRGIPAPAEQIAAWMVNPSDKEVLSIAKSMHKLTGTVDGNIVGFFVFQADKVIRHTLERYLELINESYRRSTDRHGNSLRE